MSLAWDSATGKITNHVKSIKQAKSGYQTLFDIFGKGVSTLMRFAATRMGIDELWQGFRRGLTSVKEFDAALIEMKLVSQSNSETMKEFSRDAQALAHDLAQTNTTIVQSATNWRRLGYEMEDSLDLAKSSATLSTGGFMDAQVATEGLTSALQAFSSEYEDASDYATEIVDKYIKIGNEYAVTAEDLASGLTKSSAAMVAAGNDLDQIIALTTAGNTVLQDADVVSNALKVVSMRLRGTTASALEDAGEDTEGLIEDASKLYATIKDLTKTNMNPEGVSILTDTGAYKSTYQILLEIAEIWKELGETSGGDMKQAALLETMAGKLRANAVAAILQSPDLLKDIYETSVNAEGAGVAALETSLESINAKVTQFQNTINTIWQNFLNSDVLKFIMDIANGFAGIVEDVGALPTLLTAAFTVIGVKAGKQNMGGDKCFLPLRCPSKAGGNTERALCKGLGNYVFCNFYIV